MALGQGSCGRSGSYGSGCCSVCSWCSRGAGGAATAGKEFLKSTAQNAVNEFKKHPINFVVGSYSTVQGIAALPQIMEKFHSPKLEKKLQHLEDLAKDGKNVTVLEVKQITPTRLAIKYTVNGVEYSETIDNK